MNASLIEKLQDGPLNLGEFGSLSGEQDLENGFNTTALAVARRFMADELEFEAADQVMNRLFSLMVDAMVAAGEEAEFPEPAYSIYLAFDDGEVSWPRGEDPVARYTRPKLSRILDGIN